MQHTPAKPPRRFTWAGLIVTIPTVILLPQFVTYFAFGPTPEDEAKYSSVMGALSDELLPDLGGALLAAALIIWLGWTRVVVRDDHPTRRWVWIVPIGLIAAALIGLDLDRLASAGPALVLVLFAATLCTGLSEELLFRGVVLQFLRLRSPEIVAGIVSSFIFGATHMLNALVLGAGAVPQSLLAMAMGYLLYIIRRAGGGIWLPIVVHWLYDASTFSRELGSGTPDELDDRGFLLIVLQLFFFVVVVVGHRWISPRPRAEKSTAQVG